MFGRNETLPRDHAHPVGLLKVQGEPFYTIQGEGPLAGMPALFIRLWGCHLHCYFCDTDFESDKRETKVEDILRLTRNHVAPLIVLTGGEPMRQNITELCMGLLEQGKIVQVETAGSFWIDGQSNRGWKHVVANHRFKIVCSPKTPAINSTLSNFVDAYKYIISIDTIIDHDGLPIMNTQESGGRAHKLARPPAGFPREDVYLQPMDEHADDPMVNAANAQLCRDLAMKHGYRVSTQLHKLWRMP
jgi:organic radical activating enzyme